MKFKNRLAHLFLFVAMFFTITSCSTGVLKGDWTKSLTGRTGYLREPVQIVKDEKKNWSAFEEFKRCEPVEIVEARKYGKNTGLVVRQEGKLFYLWSAHTFVNEYRGNPSEAMLNEYIASTKDDALGEKKMVTLNSGKFDTHQLQCQSTYWPGMTENQLVFVKGRPNEIRKAGTKEEWFYSQNGQQQVFDIENGVLVRW